MKLPFFGPSYKSRAIPMAVQECINWYFESNESGSGEEGAMIGTPGMLSCIDLTSYDNGPVRGLKRGGGFVFAVLASSVVRLNEDMTNPVVIGSIPNGSSLVSLDENGLEIVFAHTSGWSVYNYTSGVFANVTDSPSNSIIGYLDSYIFGTNPANGTYVWSNIANASIIDGLSFASAEGAPDPINTLIVDHRELLLFGEKSLEPLYSSGDPEQPAQRSGNSFIEHGCIAPRSVAKINNTVAWLGSDANGSGIVSTISGGSQQRISTHGIEHELSTYSTLADAEAYTYQDEGHSFYVLTFPSANKTWVYDFATQWWHERAFRDPLTGQLGRHRSRVIEYLPSIGKHIVGDYQEPKIYYMTLDTYSDYGNDIYRARSFMVPDSEGMNQRHDMIQVFAECGNANDPTSLDLEPKIGLARSRDYGRSYTQLGLRGIGKIGEFGKRSIWRRLGVHRQAAYRVWVSSKVKWCITKVTGKGTPLSK